MLPCIVTNFFIIKPTRCTNFPNLLRHEILHFSGSSSAHHQEFIHCTIGTGVCHTSLKTAFEQDKDGTAVPSLSCSKAVSKPLWPTPVLSVQWINSWWWAKELPETYSFSCRCKFGKLVHLVGFIIMILIGLYYRLFFCTMVYPKLIYSSRRTASYVARLHTSSCPSNHRLPLPLLVPLFLNIGKWVYPFWCLSMQSSAFIHLAKSSPFVRKFN
jgi:hypothetical protein